MRLEAERSVLVVIDIQEKLVPAVEQPDALIARVRMLLEAAAVLEIPVVFTEQYPKGLGPTVAALRESIGPEGAISKVTFACTGEPAFARRLAALGRDQVIVCGMETHVCVLQTALGLREEGQRVAVVADAVSSRSPNDRRLGLKRMRSHGVDVVTAEMVLFEWLERAGTPAFKRLSALIK